MHWLWRITGILVLFGVYAESFNLDPESFLVISVSDTKGYIPTSKSSLFGYSSSFYLENNQPWLLVGAPNASTSVSAPNATNPGAIYKCPLTDGIPRKDLCSELQMDYQGDGWLYNDKWDKGYYKPYKSNQWFGVSMDVSVAPNTNEWNFVACGHLRKNILRGDYWQCNRNFDPFVRAQCYRATGACFARLNLHDNSTDQVHRPAKINDLNHHGQFYLMLGESGASVHLSTDDFVIMGAPGSVNWKGGVITKRRNDEDTCVISRDINSNPGSYIGYSVTSLQLRPSKQVVIASGAPRFDDYGKVYIFLNDSIKHCDWRVFQEIYSQEPEFYGSYFGASILAADVDGDGFEELFVGAPFQSRTHGSEGAVYCYTIDENSATGKFALVKRLTGSEKPWSRFGTSMALAGDINLDGFNDVIVGAPYEENESGAIYLFRGSRDGIVTPFYQRIAASHFAPHFKTFGQSISTGRDFDGNGYPDIAVGAFRSDSVVVIRPRPIHNVRAKIWFPNPTIGFQSNNTNPFQVMLTVSFFYTIPRQETRNTKGLRLTYDLHIDETKRAFLLNRKNNLVQRVRETINLTSENINHPLDRNWTIAFERYPKNAYTPLTFRLNISGPSIGENITQPMQVDRLQLEEQSAMLNDSSITEFFGEIGFFKLWNQDDMCTPEVFNQSRYYSESDSNDLDPPKLFFNITSANDAPWIMGGPNELVLSVHIKNLARPARSVRVTLSHSPILNLKSVSVKDQRNKITATPFVCSHVILGSGPSSVIGVNFDVGEQIPENGSLVFNVSFVGKSARFDDEYLSDFLEFHSVITAGRRIANRPKTFHSPVQYHALIRSKGSSDGEKSFSESRSVTSRWISDSLRECCTPKEVTLEHNYDIRNTGPGLMPSVAIDILLPNDKDCVISKYVNINVKFRPAGSSKIRKILPDSYPQNTMTSASTADKNVNCSQAKSCECQPCSSRRFKIGTMFPEDSLDIFISVDISTACLPETENMITFTSVVNVTTPTKHQWSKASSALKRVLMYSLIPIWIYVVSAAVGLLILVGVIIGCWKCGFFKRKDYTKKKDQILRQSQMARRTVRASETDADGTVDDDPKKSLCVEEESPKSLTSGAAETKRCLSVAVDEKNEKIVIVTEDEH